MISRSENSFTLGEVRQDQLDDHQPSSRDRSAPARERYRPFRRGQSCRKACTSRRYAGAAVRQARRKQTSGGWGGDYLSPAAGEEDRPAGDAPMSATQDCARDPGNRRCSDDRKGRWDGRKRASFPASPAATTTTDASPFAPASVFAVGFATRPPASALQASRQAGVSRAEGAGPARRRSAQALRPPSLLQPNETRAGTTAIVTTAARNVDVFMTGESSPTGILASARVLAHEKC